MENKTKLIYNNLEFMFIQGCGLQLMENGKAAYTESSEEGAIRKEFLKILDKIETDNDVKIINCGSSGIYCGQLMQVLENGKEIAEFVILWETEK